jgi:hypothetical protein
MSKSLFEQFTEGVATAITDVREKVVEEAYFGRVVTDSPDTAAAAPEKPDSPSLGGKMSVAWAGQDEPVQSAWQEKVQEARAKDIPAPDHGIER